MPIFTGFLPAGTGSLVSAPLFAYVIYNPTTNTVAGLISRSATAPTMPSGYTFKWRCAGTFTNGSSQLLRTIQYGARAQYVMSASVTTVLPLMGNGAAGSASNSAPTWVAVSITGFVPTTASEIGVVLGNAPGANRTYAAPNNLYTGAGTINLPPMSVTYPNPAAITGKFLLESSNIYYASDVGGVLQCFGWTDNI